MNKLLLLLKKKLNYLFPGIQSFWDEEEKAEHERRVKAMRDASAESTKRILKRLDMTPEERREEERREEELQNFQANWRPDPRQNHIKWKKDMQELIDLQLKERNGTISPEEKKTLNKLSGKLFPGLKKNKKQEKIRVHWDDTEDIGIVTHYKGKPFTGVMFRLYDNGDLELEYEMVDGLKCGKSKGYHKNGQLQYEGNFKNDKKDGLIKEWYENGQLQYKVNYKDGKHHGLVQKWYKNGQLLYEQNWIDGEIVDLKKWYENGELEGEEYYKDDKPDGIPDTIDLGLVTGSETEQNLKTKFLEKVKLYNPGFKVSDSFNISFVGMGGEFGGFEDMEIDWDFENDENFLYDFIHNSNIKIDYTDRGTHGTIEYDRDGKLYIHTEVFGYTGLSVDDDDWGNVDGELHSVEIK